MKKIDVQLEYISFIKDNVKLNFLFLDKSSKRKLNKFSYNFSNVDNYVKLKETFNEFLETNNYVLNQETDVVLSTNDVFHTSLILPKSARNKLNKFIENDLIDKFGSGFKAKYRVNSVISKYKNGGIAVSSSLISNDLIRKVKDILANINLKLKNITSINLLLNEKNKFLKKSDSKIILYVKNDYTAINVYVSGALVDQFVSIQSYEYLTSLNIVERRKLIRELTMLVTSLIGKHDILDQTISFNDIDLYCTDEVLSHQFKYENPLKFTYNVIGKENFDFDIVKKVAIPMKKPFLRKGFTLMETVVSLTIFSISAIGLITAITFLTQSNNINVQISKAHSFIADIAEIYQNNHSLSSKYYVLSSKGITYIDENYELTNAENSWLSFSYSENESVDNHLRVLTLSNVNLDHLDKTIIDSLVIKSIN